MKYPRTYHLPWSKGFTSDDKILTNIDNLYNKNVVITEKLDGENTSFYKNKIHARSLDSKHHPSRSWVKNFWAQKTNIINDNIQIVGESMFAKHSISYDKLSSYFYAFCIIKDDITILSWKETVSFCNEIGIEVVPILYEGKFDDKIIDNINLKKSKFGNEIEGYVVRIVESFNIKDFGKYVGKYVRSNHIQTDIHWIKNWTKNKLGE